ncbi:MmcQ/YjbR family DNA-binding protein [Geodermatophilus sp. SYSU D01105]
MELLAIAMGTAAQLPAVTHEHPFGPEWEVFKVVGKVFLLATEVPGEPVVTLKCEPEHSRALQQRYAEVVPGYHMDKRHWLTIRAGDAMTRELVDELVRNSYELVVEGLPRRKRPTGARQSHGEPQDASVPDRR